MERILDRQNNPQPKNSWKPVLITNGVLIVVWVLLALAYFIYTNLDLYIGSMPLHQKTILSLFFVAICTVISNAFIALISAFFSTNYWKKWLIMLIFGFILFAFATLMGFLFDR